MTPEGIAAEMTLEQKAAQMVQPILYKFRSTRAMQADCYGSIYGDEGILSAAAWRNLSDGYQRAAIASGSGIPFLLAQDDAHGVGYCDGAVIFPHNIGQGAANDEELAYQVGLITADEAKLCHMLWNLYPCVAQSCDPRWGRNYEMEDDPPPLPSMSSLNAFARGFRSMCRLATAYWKPPPPLKAAHTPAHRSAPASARRRRSSPVSPCSKMTRSPPSGVIPAIFISSRRRRRAAVSLFARSSSSDCRDTPRTVSVLGTDSMAEISSAARHILR